MKLDVPDRQKLILKLIAERGFVSISKLAGSLRVSEQTVRRDLAALSDRGLVDKVHGGAGLPHGPSDLGYESRRSRFAAEKQRIARALVQRIPDGATLFIDIGTTMEAVAEALLGHRSLTVITNHLTVATILSRRTEFQIILAGGILRHNDHATTGEATREFLERFRVGFGIFGIGGVSPEGDLLDFDFRDIGVSTTAMRISRRKLVALDHSKFEMAAMVRIGSLADVDAVFTDASPPARIERMLEASGVELCIAEA
ncbi:MAG: DeoR/GlpR family DNA-binding transcription regulator [Hyphomicrobiaceae bacterium]